jgi:hypothetical protein
MRASPAVSRLNYQTDRLENREKLARLRGTFVSGGDVTNNKPALLVFYGLIIASVTVWVSLAVTML